MSKVYNICAFISLPVVALLALVMYIFKYFSAAVKHSAEVVTADKTDREYASLPSANIGGGELFTPVPLSIIAAEYTMPAAYDGSIPDTQSAYGENEAYRTDRHRFVTDMVASDMLCISGANINIIISNLKISDKYSLSGSLCPL